MKKYTNMDSQMQCVEFEGNMDSQMQCVEFEGVAQFLRRGQSVTNDLKTIRVPKGVLVEDVDETKQPEAKKTTKKK